MIKKKKPGALIVSRTISEVTLTLIGQHRDNKIVLSGDDLDRVDDAIKRVIEAR